MQCPFCPTYSGDLFGLSLHLEDAHPEHQSAVVVGVIGELPVMECDIDAIYRNRPDLVKGSHAAQCAEAGAAGESTERRCVSFQCSNRGHNL